MGSNFRGNPTNLGLQRRGDFLIPLLIEAEMLDILGPTVRLKDFSKWSQDDGHGNKRFS